MYFIPLNISNIIQHVINIKATHRIVCLLFILSFETQCVLHLQHTSVWTSCYSGVQQPQWLGATAVDSEGLEALMPEFTSRLFNFPAV